MHLGQHRLYTYSCCLSPCWGFCWGKHKHPILITLEHGTVKVHLNLLSAKEIRLLFCK